MTETKIVLDDAPWRKLNQKPLWDADLSGVRDERDSGIRFQEKIRQILGCKPQQPTPAPLERCYVGDGRWDLYPDNIAVRFWIDTDGDSLGQGPAIYRLEK